MTASDRHANTAATAPSAAGHRHDAPAGWRRREVLAALAAAAGLPVLGHAATPVRRVGIVGGGMAGVALAWLLDGSFDVTLFEARDSLGGNVRSVEVEVAGAPYIVDLGAQFFHPGPYPAYTKLLEHLGLYPTTSGESHPFTATITVSTPGEPTPRFVSPALPERIWPVFAPWNQAGITAFGTAFAAARLRELAQGDWKTTLGEWLPTLGLDQAQIDGMILPWAASIFSGEIEQARGYSARAAMVFAARALPAAASDPLLYYVLERGMIEALARMAASFTTVQTHTNAAVESVTRAPQGGFLVQAVGAGAPVHVDDIVFSCSGPPALGLLGGLAGTAVQRAALQAIEFRDARLLLHTDPVYAPASAAARSFLNCEVQGGFCEASMWLAPVLTPAPGAPPVALWKSWATHRASLPANILAEANFSHMVPTPASLYAQAVLRSRQGEGNVWFAGGYTLPYDGQETAFISALGVALGLRAGTARTEVFAALAR